MHSTVSACPSYNPSLVTSQSEPWVGVGQGRKLTSMDSDVFFQVLSQSESFVTIVTTEWSLISMNHLMSMKIFKQSKSPPTCLTLMWPRFIT